MNRKTKFMTAGDAARRLGISAKALRIYESRGLLAPDRRQAGWRNYGAEEIKRAAEIVALRRLGLGLSEIAALLSGKSGCRETVLAEHQCRLESQARQLDATISALNRERHRQPVTTPAVPAIAFDLPWPWGGERFTLPDLEALTYITGPLGSGKTRLALRLAEALPNGRFLGLDRLDEDGILHLARLDACSGLRLHCEQILQALAMSGATVSSALTILVTAIFSDEPGALVVDMVEQGLDHATQQALIRLLRQRHIPARPLLLMTRSSAILDLGDMESGETIIYCPANHSAPLIVRADPSCPGHEAVATCLATPEVRARTAGVIAAWTASAKPVASDSRETTS